MTLIGSDSVTPNIGHAHAAGNDWRKALSACGDALAPSPNGVLGLLYVTEPWAAHLADMAQTLKSRLGVRYWLGCVGHGIIARDREYHSTSAMSVLTLPLQPNQVMPIESIMEEKSASDMATTPWCRINAPVMALLHADPRHGNLESIIQSLVGDDVGGGFVVGGLNCITSNPGQLANTAVAGGVSGVMLASSVPVAVTLTQGCTPIGPTHVVTSGRRGVLSELDGQRALDVLTQDVGKDEAADLRRMGGYIHVALPVPGSDRGEYTVRNLMGADPTRGVIAVGADLNAGDRLFFVRRDASAALQDLRRALADLKARIGTRKILAGHYVSCVARPEMFADAGGEVAVIRSILGDFPMTGFFAGGEICASRIYGYTGVLTVFLDQAL